jgi:hypothetical protein
MNLSDMFLSALVLTFSIVSMIAGATTAYYGTGRSRTIGSAIFMLGILGFVFLSWFAGTYGPAVRRPIAWDVDLIIAGFVAVGGAFIGILIALGVFLGGVMNA